MKRLYLLRHAKAQSTASEDKLRKLSGTGKKQADLLGEYMQKENFIPERILCSPATRTRETLDCILEHIGQQATEYPEGFYYSTPGDLITTIQTQDNAHSSLMIVNHNPAIHQLAFMLCGNGPEAKIQELAVMYKPCTLTVLDCDIDEWAALMPGQNSLTALIPPFA